MNTTGRILYERYRKSTPTWEQLDDAERKRWRDVAAASNDKQHVPRSDYLEAPRYTPTPAYILPEVPEKPPSPPRMKARTFKG